MKVRFTSQLQAPDVSRGMKVPYAPGRRNQVQWRWYLILALVLSPFAYLLFTLLYPIAVLTAPGFIHLEKETLTATTDGVVKVIHVRAGDRVTAGQPLVEAFSPKLEERIQSLTAALAQSATMTSQPMVETGAHQEGTLALYRQQVEAAQQVVDRQQQRVETVRSLFSQGAATAAEVNALQVHLENARHTLVQARLDLRGAEQKYLAREMPELASMPDALQMRDQLAKLREQEQSLLLRAPLDGTVLDIPVEIGHQLIQGEVIALIGTQRQPHVLAYLKPRSIQAAQPGSMATVSIPGGRSLEARVRAQPSQARRLPADLSSLIGTRDIMVLVMLDFIDPLPPERAVEGLPVEVRFHRF